MSNEHSGERIEQLMASFAASGPLMQQRAEELVRLVTEFHGSGLNRVFELTDETGVLTDELLERFAGDDLVSGMLLLHGMHPYDVETRIERALNRVRPYLGSHGGDVRLVEVSEGRVARLRMLGNCQGCPSSTITLKLAVEGAVEASAPEIEAIECDDSPEEAAEPSLITPASLFQRLHTQNEEDTTATVAPHGATWAPVDLPELAPGEVRTVVIADTAVVVCRVGATTYAYRDRCAGCGSGLAGARLHRIAGSAAGSVALTCPQCRAHFDVANAGAEVEDTTLHLEPLPLLDNNGQLEVAVPRVVSV